MFRNRKEDEMNDENSTGQSSLLSNNSGAQDDSATNSMGISAPASMSNAASLAGYQVSQASRPVNEPISRPQGPLPTALNPFRSQPAGDAPRARMPESKSNAFSSSSNSGITTSAPAERNKDSRRVLTVGSDILLKGEIATCDRLVIEGKVDAVLNDVGTVELAESGSFKGVAQVENAEISGLFEGELVVKGRLVIYASGRVRGKITYGEIEIERGGELTGDIKIIGAAPQARKTGEKAAAPKEDKVTAAA